MGWLQSLKDTCVMYRVRKSDLSPWEQEHPILYRLIVAFVIFVVLPLCWMIFTIKRDKWSVYRVKDEFAKGIVTIFIPWEDV